MSRSDPWSDPPKSAAWRRLARVVVPLALASCDNTERYNGTVVGCPTNETCESADTGQEYPGTVAPNDSGTTP